MTKIFFSYRRIDSEATTKRVYRQFVKSFGFWRFLGADTQNLFLDKDNLIPKGDFRAQIQRFIIQSDHMLVFISKDWLTEIKGRQAAGEVDFVLIEIESAFIHQVNVIPVLLHGAGMPSRADLPDDIKQLAMQQAHIIKDAYFEEDVARLIKITKPALSYWIGTFAALLILLIGLSLFINNTLKIFSVPSTEFVQNFSDTPEATQSDSPTPNPSDTLTPTITYTPSITPLSEADIRGTSQAEVFATFTQVYILNLSQIPPTLTQSIVPSQMGNPNNTPASSATSNADFDLGDAPAPSATSNVDFDLGNSNNVVNLSTSLNVQITEIEHDVTLPSNPNYNSMAIHMNVEASGYLNQQLLVAAYVFYENGDPVVGSSDFPSWRSLNGQLSVSTLVTAIYETSIWEDLVLYVCYCAFPSFTSNQNAYVQAGVVSTSSLEAMTLRSNRFNIIIFGRSGVIDL